MAFSLSSWFKGKNGPDAPADTDKPSAVKSVAPGRSPRVTRSLPTSVRKAVPNSVQPVSLRDPSARSPVQLPIGVLSPGPTQPMRAASTAPPRRITFGNPAALAAAHPAAPEPPPSLPEPAPAYEPASVPDVPVTLEVGDFIDRLPPNILAAGAVDRCRVVEFHSSEFFSDLARGRASVPASIIYEKCPEIFSRPVSATEDTEVPLPLAKLVEQLAPAFQTRADQVAEENVGEIETPFLQVAMEDSTRLPAAAGTTTGPIQPAAPLPAAPVEVPPRPAHRTGQIQTITIPRTVPTVEPSTIASPPVAGPINPSNRPPPTVRASVAGGKIRLSGPSVPTRMSLQPGGIIPPVPAVPPMTASNLPPSATQRIASPMVPVPAANSPSHQVTKKSQRIQIPPISLRVAPVSPAPSRPAAPSPPTVPVQPSPVTIRPNGAIPPASDLLNFRASPPPPSVKPLPQSFVPPPVTPHFPSSTPEPTPAPSAATPADARQITLGLAAVLRGLSPSLLAVDPSSIADDVKIELPFAPIEPQLSTGRVNVTRGTFIAALPDHHKEVLDPSVDLPEVPLPLQEVFQNLPTNALQIRADQVEEQISHLYPTPFSQKADEDAQRLGVGEARSSAPTNETAAAVETPAAPTDHSLTTDRQLPADEPPAETPPLEVKPAENRDIPLALVEAAPIAEPEAKAEAPAPIKSCEPESPAESQAEPEAKNPANPPPAPCPSSPRARTPNCRSSS